MKVKSEKQQLLDQYVKLARKLGKVPSAREVRKFICSGDKLSRVWGKFSALKKAAMADYPDLDIFTMPAVLKTQDLEEYRIGLEYAKRTKQNKKLITDVSTFDYIEKFAAKVFDKPITPYKATDKTKNPKTRAVTLTLSDLHFGGDLKSEETGADSYGAVEEARRLAEIVRQTCDYKPQYRKETKLVLNLGGDLFEGKLHDPQDAAPMSEQVCRTIHLLGQAIAHLAAHYPEVQVNCTTGNHGRDMNRHSGRATTGKWDSIETVIYFALKTALKAHKNVSFSIPKTPYVMYEVFGAKYFLTHGDNVLNAGNPGKSINVRNLEFQLNRINASLQDKDEVKVAIVGHTHVASVSLMAPGVTVVTNGALTPVNGFAVSLGILEGVCSQTLFEAVPGHPIGDIRFIRVDSNTDKDSTLDDIIKPWSGF